jgi:hypothetical protein
MRAGVAGRAAVFHLAMRAAREALRARNAEIHAFIGTEADRRLSTTVLLKIPAATALPVNPSARPRGNAFAAPGEAPVTNSVALLKLRRGRVANVLVDVYGLAHHPPTNLAKDVWPMLFTHAAHVARFGTARHGGLLYSKRHTGGEGQNVHFFGEKKRSRNHQAEDRHFD